MIKEHVTHKGQGYVDIAKYASPRSERLRSSVRGAIGLQPVPRTPIVIGYDRIELAWVTPNQGGT